MCCVYDAIFFIKSNMLFGSFGLLTKELIQSCFVRRRWRCPCAALVIARLNRNFIFGTHVQICPWFMHIKYFVILMCFFKRQPFWYYSLIWHPDCAGGHRYVMLNTLMQLLFTYIPTRSVLSIFYNLLPFSESSHAQYWSKILMSTGASCVVTF